MPEPLSIGLDFGGLGCRAAYQSGGQMVFLLGGDPRLAAAQWLRCERSPSSLIGVRFPSLKSKIGSDGEANATLRESLAGIRRTAEQISGRPAGRAVVSVPALYPSSKRTALREIAAQAGFAEVHLLNDGMAAVMSHAGRDASPRTLLVYGAGYSGFEIALIRVAKGRYRSLGYEGGTVAGGAAFDAVVLRGCLQAWTVHGLWKPGQDLSDEAWLGFRARAQDLKEALGSRDSAGLMSMGMMITFPRAGLSRAVRDLMDGSLEAADKLLDDASHKRGDVDEILLVGGSAHMAAVREAMAHHFGRDPVLLPETALARGASLFAAELGALPAAEMGAPAGDEMEEPETEDPAVPVVQVRLSSADASATEPEPSSSKPGTVFSLDLAPPMPAEGRLRPDDTAPAASLEKAAAYWRRIMAYVRKLIADGAYDRASGFLRGLGENAQGLMESLPNRAGAGGAIAAEESLSRAHDLLDARDFPQAVVETHRAYQFDPETPAVFQQMIDIHCQAAMAYDSPEGYPTAMKWLMCALSHDRTNQEIHQRIAERSYLHASQVAAGGDIDGALRALEECLYYDRDHAGANALRDRLSKREPSTP